MDDYLTEAERLANERARKAEARVAELEEAGTISKRLLIQGHTDEALEHLIQNFKP